MSAWRWVSADVVYAVHEIQLARHGGLDGIRDKNAVESALARPQQLNVYGNPEPDVADLAAAYAHGLTTHHGFSDGNKRTAWVVARVFLADNGIVLKFDPLEAVFVMESVADGTLGMEQLAQWFREHIVR